MTTTVSEPGVVETPQQEASSCCSDKENNNDEARPLTASALKELSSETPRPRSFTADTDVTSDTSDMHTRSLLTDMSSPPVSALVHSDLRQSTPPTWDSFVRQGARLKSLLGDTMLNVRNYHNTSKHSNKRKQCEIENSENQPRSPQRARLRENRDPVKDLLQEKSNEILQLRRLLKESQAESTALQATNTFLREEVASVENRLERTTQAMRASSESAAKARADAEAAEATAASLAQTLQSLQAVVDETKSATYLLHQEQQQLAETSTSLETKLVQKEADLTRAYSALRTLRNEKATFDLQAAKWKYEKSNLERRYEHAAQEVDSLRKTMFEREAIETARKERAQKVEEELRQVQTLLKQATAGQEESAKTQAALQEALVELQKANETIQTRLTTQQEAARKETTRLCEALTKAEREAQDLRIQNEASSEAYERLRLDKLAADKLNAQLKSQLARLELQQKEAGTTPFATSIPSFQTPCRSSLGLSISLPPLGGSAASEKSNNVANQSSTCCICFKASFGIMNRCQCGKADCNKRVHMTCANRVQPSISVSHPGTPAPPLPLVLCGNVSGLSARKTKEPKDDE